MSVSSLHPSRPKVHRVPGLAPKRRENHVVRNVILLTIAALVVGAIPTFMIWQRSDMVEKKSPELVSVEIKNQDVQETDNGKTKSDNPLVVHNDKGEVVGQLAKMPGDSAQMLHIDTTKKVDNNTGKELLEIIGKY